MPSGDVGKFDDCRSDELAFADATSRCLDGPLTVRWPVAMSATLPANLPGDDRTDDGNRKHGSGEEPTACCVVTVACCEQCVHRTSLSGEPNPRRAFENDELVPWRRIVGLDG